MKKKTLGLLTLSLLLFGCERVNTSISDSDEPSSYEESSPILSVPSEESSSTIEEESSSSEIEVTNVHIVVNYKYPDGTIIDKKEVDYEENEEFEIVSPEINFMSPDLEKVSGTATTNQVYDVTYNYSNKALATIKKGQKFEPFYVNKNKGISFTYVISGNSSDYAEIFSGNNFTIYNATLRAKDAYEPESFYADFYSSDAVAYNGAAYDAFLTNKEYEILVTISINPDGSINFFKDKELVFTYQSSQGCSDLWNPTGNYDPVRVSTLADAIFEDIAENGFKMGLAYIGPVDYTIKDLSINYALTPFEVARCHSKYGSVTIQYKDYLNKEVALPIRNVGLLEDSYSIESPEIDELTPSIAVVEGRYNETKNITVDYNFAGTELIDNPILLDKTTVGAWSDKTTWRYIATELSGDFKVMMKYHMNGCLNIDIVDRNSGHSTNAGNYCWRTILSVIEDSITKDRWVSRIDWYGWLDDVNVDGKVLGGSATYNAWMGGFTWEWDFGPILRNCDVYVFYERNGSKLTITSKIMPLDEPYVGKVFTYICTLDGVSSDKLDIAFTAEYAKVEALSVIKQ